MEQEPAGGDGGHLSTVGEKAPEAVARELWEIVSEGHVRTLLQPLVSMNTGNVIGYEALSRGPRGSRLESPEQLFAASRHANLLFSLERVCRRKALIAKSRFMNKEQLLFLNVDPQVIYEAQHQADITKEVMATLGIEPREVVLELTERTAITDYKGFARALAHYVHHGYQVAVDDVGSGYSNLRLIAEVKPDYIKVDMSLVQGIDQDTTKQALLETLVSLAGKVSASTVAEGVETADELRTLADLGVDHVQGYFLARPGEQPPSVSAEAADLLRYLLGLSPTDRWPTRGGKTSLHERFTPS